MGVGEREERLTDGALFADVHFAYKSWLYTWETGCHACVALERIFGAVEVEKEWMGKVIIAIACYRSRSSSDK